MSNLGRTASAAARGRPTREAVHARLAFMVKELKDYLEVSGYAGAARWVYSQALSSGPWASGKLLTITEVRHVHRLAMTPVWEVAPHPDASDDESPGNWRRHDIHAFKHGMKPP